MGMFDTVHFKCPKCETMIEEQTKAGACDLKDYKQGAVPPAIAACLDGDILTCLGCSTDWRIVSSVSKYVPLQLVGVEYD